MPHLVGLSGFLTFGRMARVVWIEDSWSPFELTTHQIFNAAAPNGT
jgi:hypothetical protein